MEFTRTDFLPFCRPDISEDAIIAVEQVLRSDWLTAGPKTAEFEQRFREYIGCRHAIATNSGTAALHLAVIALGIGEGDEVITTPLTFCATAHVVVHERATPVFVDIREDYNIDPDAVRARITPRTRAVIPVHIAGHSCAMDEILASARAHSLYVIEDAAHALGTRCHGRFIGSIGDATAFSFYATKNITTAEGGMLTTDDDELAKRVRLLSQHGIDRDAWRRTEMHGSWYYEVQAAGYKYNMCDIQAALGLEQLARLEGFVARRRQLAAWYTEGLQGVPEIATPTEAPGARHAWHLYIIRLDTDALRISRNQFIAALREHNIGTSVHFIPLHLQPYYRDTYGYRPGDFPVAEFVYERIVSLPLYTRMTRDDVEYVVGAVREIVARHRR
ncbi:MAG: UDP-4-amino-4,6-dideoxy-N-acetyl-beta-L-altrosamine transaminase [Anaerolineae bacterium]|nr:UDP-4-amino-4,6-dideoxy-N-acetyl-beta-L-altrosamine transaminase [Anaerolineae bacterium]